MNGHPGDAIRPYMDRLRSIADGATVALSVHLICGSGDAEASAFYVTVGDATFSADSFCELESMVRSYVNSDWFDPVFLGM